MTRSMAPARSCAPVEWRFAQRTLTTAVQITSATTASVAIARTTACTVCVSISVAELRSCSYSERFSNQSTDSASAPTAKAAAHQTMATLGTDVGENGVIDTWD